MSRHDIAGIWVAFFSRCQRYRCVDRLSADLADGLAAAALLIEHGGRGIFPFCRRRSHSEGIGRVAETVQAYFARDVDEGKRKELTRCVSERARMAAAGEFASEDVVNAVLLEAQAKHGAKEEV